MSSTGTLAFTNGFFNNSGASLTASTISAGSVVFLNGSFFNPITSSSTTALIQASGINFHGVPNTTIITHNSTASSNSFLDRCSIISGTAAAITIGTGAALTVTYLKVSSSNANFITGLGTLNYAGIINRNTGNAINTSTINLLDNFAGTVL